MKIMDVLQDGVLAFVLGLRDTLIGCFNAIKIVFQNSKIRSKVVLCFILNGLILALSVVIFEQLILPIILFLVNWISVIFKKDLSEIHLEWLESIISYIFTGLWMLPMFVISTPINSLWFRDIAVECYDHMKKRQHDLKKPKQRWSLKMLITDLLYGVAIEVVFMIQATIIKLVPVGGWFIALLHMALLYSLYSFEYKWFYQGVTVQRRLSCIEAHWPYFLGYGFPLAVLTSTPLLSPFAVGGSHLRHTAGNIILSACVFALSFPLMVLGAFSVTHSELSFNRLPIFKLARILCNNLFRLVLPKR